MWCMQQQLCGYVTSLLIGELCWYVTDFKQKSGHCFFFVFFLWRPKTQRWAMNQPDHKTFWILCGRWSTQRTRCAVSEHKLHHAAPTNTSRFKRKQTLTSGSFTYGHRAYLWGGLSSDQITKSSHWRPMGWIWMLCRKALSSTNCEQRNLHRTASCLCLRAVPWVQLVLIWY